MGSRHLGQDGGGWGGGGIPDIGGVPDMGWSSRHGMGFQTWGGIPDTGRVPDMG